MRVYISLSLAVVTFLFISPANAQQESYWIRYYNQLTLSPRWVWHNEVDERRLLKPDRQAQFFIHSHIHYLLSKKIDVGLGFNHNLSRSKTGVTIPEWRPWQEISFNTGTESKVKFNIRYRVDERFIHHASVNQLEEGYRFSLRHRFRVQVSCRIGKNENINLKISDEVMLNTTSGLDPFDQNRIFTGAEIQLGKSLSLESGYLNQRIQRSGQLETVHILRTTLYHRIRPTN